MADADIIDTNPDADIIAGGDYGMLQFLPFVPMALGAGIGALKQIEANRYWDRYYRNTGHRPRYPWMSGVYNGYEHMAYSTALMGSGGYKVYNYRRYRRY